MSSSGSSTSGPSGVAELSLGSVHRTRNAFPLGALGRRESATQAPHHNRRSWRPSIRPAPLKSERVPQGIDAAAGQQAQTPRKGPRRPNQWIRAGLVDWRLPSRNRGVAHRVATRVPRSLTAGQEAKRTAAVSRLTISQVSGRGRLHCARPLPAAPRPPRECPPRPRPAPAAGWPTLHPLVDFS